MHPNDIRAVAEEEYNGGLESLGSGPLRCSLCRSIVKRLDEFLTNPTLIENASESNNFYYLIVFLEGLK